MVESLLAEGALIDVRDKSDRTPLSLAAQSGNAELVKLLLAEGADVHLRADCTPLHLAVERDSGPVARLLLAHGVDLEASDTQGNTPLHTATRLSRPGMAKLLLDRGANVHAVNRQGDTPLHLSAGVSTGKPTGQVLLAFEACPSERNRQGETPLDIAFAAGFLDIASVLADHDSSLDIFRAAALGKVARVVALFNAMPSLLFATDAEGKTALHWAAEFGQARVASALLNFGARLNTSAGQSDDTPLDLAVRRGQKAIVELFLKYFAEARLPRNLIDRALTVAVSSNQLELARLLVDHRADVGYRDVQGRTLLHFAAESGDRRVVEWGLSMRRDVNVTDKFGRTPLHVAADRRSVAVTEHLLAVGAGEDLRDSRGRTALHVAAGRGSGEVVRRLAHPKADLQARDVLGQTPLHLAAASGIAEPVTVLVALRADVNARDREGRTPLHALVGNVPPAFFMCGRGFDEWYEKRQYPPCGDQWAETIGCLLRAGADVNARDNEGRKLVQYLSIGHAELETLLGSPRQP